MFIRHLRNRNKIVWAVILLIGDGACKFGNLFEKRGFLHQVNNKQVQFTIPAKLDKYRVNPLNDGIIFDRKLCLCYNLI
jgi:hypothetical protein